MDQKKEVISVIIPAYNEAVRISSTLTRMDEYLRGRFRDFELIVVNDGSSDNTEDVVRSAMTTIPSIKYAGYEKNRGKGYAIRRGIALSRGDIVLISDADLSTPIEEVEKLLLRYQGGYDVVIGSRGLEESSIMVRQPWWREFMGKTFNRLVRMLLLTEFRDTQCGFKLFNGAIARELFGRTTIDRFAYDVEILSLGMKAGYRISEVPVQWFNSPGSRVRPLRDSFQMAKDLIRIRLRNSGGRR
jgi:dolichyl-phosphate beta-glucosyltransferase